MAATTNPGPILKRSSSEVKSSIFVVAGLVLCVGLLISGGNWLLNYRSGAALEQARDQMVEATTQPVLTAVAQQIANMQATMQAQAVVQPTATLLASALLATAVPVATPVPVVAPVVDPALVAAPTLTFE